MRLRNENGVTIMNLVITIIIMIILISIAGYYSLDSIQNSYTANEKKELASVVEFASVLKTHLLLEEFALTEDTVVSQDTLYTYENKIADSVINKILEVNLSTLDANYKFHYINAEKIADKTFSGGKINVKDVQNDYIINFYTGTVIGLYDSKCEISGIVKGLTDILLEVNG